MASKGAGGVLIAAGAVIVAVVFGVLVMKIIHRPPPLPKPRAAATQTASDELNIDVYLDGSKSMRQFLKGERPGQTNYLRALLLDLGTRMNSAHGNHTAEGKEWSNATVNYWNFGAFRGTEIAQSQHPFAKPLSEPDLRELAENPDAGFNATRTPIEKPITDRQDVDGKTNFDSKLKVIITDLYQSGGDTATYANPLVNQYLEDDTKAVEVIAVRNPFAGVVDDLPGCGTLQKAADTMPFYVIVAGPVGDVRRAVEVLKGTTGLSAANGDEGRMQEWFFTRAPKALSGEEALPTVQIRNTKEKGHPWRNLKRFKETDYPKVDAGKESGLTVLTMRKGAEAQVSWATLLDVDGRPLARTELSPEVTVSRSDAHGRTLEDVEAKAAVRLSCDEENSDGVCVTIDSARLRSPLNYLVEVGVDARPALGAALPETLKPGSPTMRRWNIEVADTPSVCRSGFRDRAGMTPQLSQFLVALYDKKLNTKVRMATYSLYVEAR